MENLPMDRAATKGGIVMALALIGAPLGGYLTDLWLKKRKNARLIFPTISSLATSLALFAAFVFMRDGVQYAALLVTGIVAVAFVPGAVAVTQDVVHPGLRAISLSLCVVIQHILGSALGPPFVGAMSDIYGLQNALKFLPAFTLLASVLFFVASFFYVNDTARAEDVEIRLEY
jgi:MFS family permease